MFLGNNCHDYGRHSQMDIHILRNCFLSHFVTSRYHKKYRTPCASSMCSDKSAMRDSST